MSDNILYRVLYIADDVMHEIYATEVSDDALFGFVRVKDLQFQQDASQLVIDPNAEKLRQEFQGVTMTFIPVHEIVRIDVVQSLGPSKIKPKGSLKSATITPFPKSIFPMTEKD